mgnify:CR=1 FL=1
MQQRVSVQGLMAALEQLGSWVLDQPVGPGLQGQRCDRLRPAVIRQELEHVLHRTGNGGCVLVDWRWDSRMGCARGWLWHRGQVQRFCWWRASERLELHSQLQCSAIQPLRVHA